LGPNGVYYNEYNVGVNIKNFNFRTKAKS